MNIQETTALLTKIQLGDNREVTELVVREWHDTVGFLEYGDAVEAVRLHRRESAAYLLPAHVVAGARRVARDRAEVEARDSRQEVRGSGAPKPTNFEEMSAAWDDPVEWARHVRAYDAQLAAAGVAGVDAGLVEARLRALDASSRRRSWRGAGW